MTFHVGQKVVCVDDEARYGDLYPLKAGVTYTVRSIGPFCHPLFRITEVCVCVEEITRQDDFPYLARRFRPLVERKTDISIFHRILQQNSNPVPAKPVAAG